MAYENLRAAITQNIKTNNQEEITGAVMQQILLQMVNELGAWESTLSGYATTQWVQEQLNGYVSQAALSNYLPLTGGTLTGDLYLTNGEKINIILIEGRRIVDLNLGYSQINGTEYAWNMYVESALDVSAGLDMDGIFVGSGFKKIDGTSAQFLKADGSVDSNAYLPLTGGTLTGSLFFASNGIDRGEIFGDEYGLNIQVSGQGKLLIENAIEANSTIKTEGFIKRGGTADQVLCADGSVKTLAQLKAALDAL